MLHQCHHTALIIAASNGATEVVRAILSVRGVNVNVQDKVSLIILLLFVYFNTYAQVLFERGPRQHLDCR